MIQERLKALRAEMEKRGITVYVVPTADFHESEYVGDHFKARKFITGFTGSAGTAVITLDEAGLWTDGRYFVQAENQLKDSTVTLYRMGEEGVPTVDEFVKDRLKEGGCLGFDGRVVNGTWGGKLEKIAAEKNVSMHVTEDLIDLIWEDRPALSKQPLFILEEKYSGKSTADKIADLRKAMKENGADVHILTSLYDIAWLLNIRGNDIDYVPVVLSYLVLNETECIWFLQEEVVDDKIRAYLEENHITTKPYDAIYDYVPEIPAMFEALTVREHIEYVKRAYNSDITEEEIDALLTRFELLDKQEKLGNELSKGMMQKVSICCALAIHPKVVMLDEPMVGLDPAAIKELKEVVLELKEKGCTILISTHMLEMVKDLWDVMFVMEQGKIIATFNKNEIADKDIEELFFEVTEPKTGGEEHE